MNKVIDCRVVLSAQKHAKTCVELCRVEFVQVYTRDPVSPRKGKNGAPCHHI